MADLRLNIKLATGVKPADLKTFLRQSRPQDMLKDEQTQHVVCYQAETKAQDKHDTPNDLQKTSAASHAENLGASSLKK